MSLLRHMRRLIYVDYLINKRVTGNPKKFAEKNRLKRSSIMNILKELKELGFGIEYDKEHQTYFYNKKDQEAKLIHKLLQIDGSEILTREQLSEICENDIHNLCFSETKIFEKCNA